MNVLISSFTEAYSEPYRKSKIELLEKIVNGWSSIFDFCYPYISEISQFSRKLLIRNLWKVFRPFRVIGLKRNTKTKTYGLSVKIRIPAEGTTWSSKRKHRQWYRYWYIHTNLHGNCWRQWNSGTQDFTRKKGVFRTLSNVYDGVLNG